jgi:hypothetical protein
MPTPCVGRRARRSHFVACAMLLTLAGSALAQPTWYDAANNRGIATNVSDVFQHQNYNTDANWENGGGWCYTTGIMNSFYFFKQRGYDGLLPNAATANATWLDTVNGELKDFSTNYFTGTTSVRGWLAAKGHGAAGGVRSGLLHTRIIENSGAGRMEYVSFDGSLKAVPQVGGFNPTVFQVATKYLEDDKSINLIIRAQGAAVVDAANWWARVPADPASYHTLTLAGFDRAGTGTLYVADPDSNKGNANANAGWAAPLRPDPALNARRYVAGDPVPVAPRGPNASDIPPNPGRDSSYASLQIDGTDLRLKTFANVAANNRFRSLYVSDLEIVERRQADLIVAAPPPITGPTGGPGPTPLTHTFEISAGLTEPVDQFWLFPDHVLASGFSLPTFTAPGGAWNLASTLLPGGLDPWTNTRSSGGLLFSLTAGAPLLPGLNGTIGLLQGTFSGLISGWDIAFRDALDSSVWRVQAYGQDLPNLPLQQIPAPAGGVIVLVGAGVLGVRRRRCLR